MSPISPRQSEMTQLSQVFAVAKCAVRGVEYDSGSKPLEDLTHAGLLDLDHLIAAVVVVGVGPAVVGFGC